MDRTVNVSAIQQPKMELGGKLEAKDDVSTTDDKTSHGILTLELAEHCIHGALVGKQVLNKGTSVLQKRNITSENTLYAQSVCPDEINHEGTEITNLLTAYFGKVFHLGGLAGIPFTGTYRVWCLYCACSRRWQFVHSMGNAHGNYTD